MEKCRTHYSSLLRVFLVKFRRQTKSDVSTSDQSQKTQVTSEPIRTVEVKTCNPHQAREDTHAKSRWVLVSLLVNIVITKTTILAHSHF